MNYQSFLKDGTLCWTLTSNGYKYLTWNFVKHWEKACPSVPLLVICADRQSYSFLQRESIPCRLVEQVVQDFGPQIVPFGSRQFSTLNRLKLDLLSKFTKDSEVKTCVYIDGDICVYKNFLEDIQKRLNSCPVLFQCDEKERECSSIMNPELLCPNVCTGFVVFRHGIQDIFKITDEQVWNQKPEDQVWVNHVLARSNILFESLPRELYPNGARLSMTKNSKELSDRAFLLHYNYRVGDIKKADMKRQGDWLLPY